MKEQSPNETPHTLQLNQGHYFLFFLLFVIFIACYNILQPYLNAIILAAILAIVLMPVHYKIEFYVKGRKNFAAFLSCSLLTIIVVVPLMLMLVALIQQGVQSFNAIQDWVASGGFKQLLDSPLIKKTVVLLDKFLPDIKRFFPAIDLKKIKLDVILLQASSTIGKSLINQGGHLLGNITALIGKFFLMIFTLFFIIRDREKITSTALHLLPLSTSQENQILTKIKTVSRSALLGTLVTAFAQGAAGGIAFWIANLPGLFWGTVMAFASLIPVIGTALIWVPATIYLFFSGHWGYGIFMLLWCSIVVGSIDNFVRPLFMKGSDDASTILIFFSILGGINYFGLIGLLYGPLILGLTIVLLYIYSLEFESFLNYQDRN